MNYYIYNVYSDKEPSKIFTIIFDYGNDQTYKSLFNELKEFYTFHYKSDVIIFLTPETSLAGAKVVDSVGNDEIKLIFGHYTIDGKIIFSDVIDVSREKIMEIGLLSVFNSNKAILSPSQSFHYVLPSGKHSPYFIRVGNMLTDMVEVHFIAFWLLPFFEKGVHKIYYDSSSILTILIALLKMRKEFGDEKGYEAISFESYKGVEHFEFSPDSLVVISASNSGDLESKILRIQSNLEVVTIVYGGKEPINTSHLLNVGRHPDLVDLVQYRDGSSCQYCKLNSIPVHIAGEQFLPLTFAKQSILLSVNCSPNWVEDFMRTFAYQDVVKAHRRENNKVRELFIDLTQLHEKIDLLNYDERESQYVSKLRKFVKNEVPHSTKYIVFLEDESSKKMAESIYGFIATSLKVEKPISQTRLNEIDTAVGCTVLICASSIATGKRLNNINKDLRNHTNLSLIYLIGILRTPRKEDSRNLIDNLRFRKDHTSDNRVKALIEINIPDNNSDYNSIVMKSPWEVERINMQTIIHEKDDAPKFINERIRQLDEPELTQNLFWYNPIDGRRSLQLNKNFAFFNFELLCKGKFVQPSQSEVYFVIASILHNLRNLELNESNNKRPGKQSKVFPLVQHEHKKSVLDPVNFERFNDGIIQAAILRAALPAELNFSFDLELSHKMKQILINLFKVPNSTSSEAILEFLYAIWIKKLRIERHDLFDFVRVVKGLYASSAEISFFFELIEEQKLR
ncbi:hypothetical protein [uncultured Imperialibacter sp.]|uniref:hypothetical protein n=1 Tax=uncultured Imperialibacter sp. TaxID=1672639 RepID=UPI0030DDCC21|tara:strand:+ start:6019 stop:8229 length:2211 start_codon:yes stop_codon:yes gene_type:complete